ncbi:MAG: hypothetical protein OXJ52_06520 [Oligoflexia bacterium]|nr:hypothetical protein [Oligoflexia bacterium]
MFKVFSKDFHPCFHEDRLPWGQAFVRVLFFVERRNRQAESSNRLQCDYLV